MSYARVLRWLLAALVLALASPAPARAQVIPARAVTRAPSALCQWHTARRDSASLPQARAVLTSRRMRARLLLAVALASAPLAYACGGSTTGSTLGSSSSGGSSSGGSSSGGSSSGSSSSGGSSSGGSSSGGSSSGGSSSGGSSSGGSSSGGSSSGGADAGSDAGYLACMDGKGTVYASLKACHADADCVMKQEQFDCCGTIMFVGVANASVAAFDTCETSWEAHFPACGCASGRTQTEDGKTSNPGQDAGAPAVHCADFTMSGGVCMTYMP